MYTSRKSHHHHYFTSFAVITAQADGTAPIRSFQDLQRHPQWLKVQQGFFPESGSVHSSPSRRVPESNALEHALEPAAEQAGASAAAAAAAAAPGECAPFLITVYTFSYSRSAPHCQNAVHFEQHR